MSLLKQTVQVPAKQLLSSPFLFTQPIVTQSNWPWHYEIDLTAVSYTPFNPFLLLSLGSINIHYILIVVNVLSDIVDVQTLLQLVVVAEPYTAGNLLESPFMLFP